MNRPLRLAVSLVWLCTSVLGSGCGNVTNLLPDGGRGRVICTDSNTRVPVKVERGDGSAALGARVFATNTFWQDRQEGLVNSQGVYVVDERLGPGAVRVSAVLNGVSSNVGEITFVCGECDCVATPVSLRLVIP